MGRGVGLKALDSVYVHGAVLLALGPLWMQEMGPLGLGLEPEFSS